MAAQDHPFTFPQPARQEEHNMPPPPPPAQPQQHQPAAAAPAPPPPQAQVVMGEAKGYLPTPVPTHQDKPVLEHSSIRPIAFTLFFVGIAVGVKLIVKYYGKWSGVIDPADISVVITGLFFILGQMLSNLSADFKESEKLPADIASSIEQLDDQLMLGENKVADKGVSHQRDVRPVLLHLTNSVIALMSSSASNSYACILHDLHILSLQCVLWDKKGAANLAPIPTTIDKIRRSCARARVISRTEALPVGQKLLLFFVFSTAVILWLTTYKNDASLVMTMVIIYGVTWTLAGAIRSMDDPFDQENWAPWGSMSSIDITPLTEYAERLQLELTAGVGAEVYQLPSSGAPMLPLLQPTQH